ncbi:MAG: hypothetical protein P1V20_20230 [Verrucomicrobiales bacterium]|nr:hypothetical protein [Verrucomicrobiales bacterium]
MTTIVSSAVLADGLRSDRIAAGPWGLHALLFFSRNDDNPVVDGIGG